MLFLAFLAAAAPQPGELRTFRDWIVGCDNGLACRATSLVPEGEELGEDGAMLSLSRGPGAGAPPIISVGTEDVSAALLADGKRLPVRLESGSDGLVVRPADIPAMLATLRSARRLEIRSNGGKERGAVSLAGVSAALLHMDERQRRAGTVTALVRPGRRGPGTVPPPPNLPRVVEVRPTAGAAPPARIAAARIAALQTAADCDPDLPLDDGGVEAHRLDDRTTLTLVPCWMGAYNATSLVLVSWRPDGGDARPASFDYNASAGERSGADVPPDGAYWDEEKGRLASFFKGRGLGDCGSGQQWAWDGTMFRLIHAEAMGECRGSIDYITTWRAEAVRR